MKNKLKIVLLIVILLCSIFLQTKSSKQSDLVFSNIEALANWEGSGIPNCISSGSVDCPVSNTKVYTVY